MEERFSSSKASSGKQQKVLQKTGDNDKEDAGYSHLSIANIR